MPRLNGFNNNYAGVGGDLSHVGSLSGAATSDITFQPSGQLSLRPFDASGQMEYRFGPHEQFAVRKENPVGGSPADDGFWPLMHSGQVLQGIKTKRDLQDLYENGRTVFVTSADGPLEVTSADEKFRVASDDRSEIHCSGLLEASDTDHETGDFQLLTHSSFINVEPLAPADQAEADAQSLGPASLVYNTGSGLANMFTIDGLSQFGQANLASLGLDTPVNLAAMFGNELINIGDYIIPIGTVFASSARVMVAGLYMCGLCINYDRNGSNTDRNIVQAALTRNGSIVRSSRARAYQRQASQGEASCHRIFFVQLEAGDELAVEFNRIHGPALLPTDVVPLNSENMVWFKYMGPRRTGL